MKTLYSAAAFLLAASLQYANYRAQLFILTHPHFTPTTRAACTGAKVLVLCIVNIAISLLAGVSPAFLVVAQSIVTTALTAQFLYANYFLYDRTTREMQGIKDQLDELKVDLRSFSTLKDLFEDYKSYKVLLANPKDPLAFASLSDVGKKRFLTAKMDVAAARNLALLLYLFVEQAAIVLPVTYAF